MTDPHVDSSWPSLELSIDHPERSFHVPNMEMLVYWLDHVGPSLTAESLTVERPETTRDPLVTARSSPLRVHPGTAAEAPRLQHPKSGAARRTRDLRGVCEKGIPCKRP